MGTFVTKSDLGIGTIVGSAVFNIFGVISVCGLFSGQKIPLDWYPITRDCLYYGFTVIVLSIVLIDGSVFWWEAMIMVIFYFGYVTIMTLNNRIERWAHSVLKNVKKRVYPTSSGSGGGANNESSVSTVSNNIALQVPNESTPLHTSASKSTQVTLHTDSENDNKPSEANGHHLDVENPTEDEGDCNEEDPGYPWHLPKGGILAKIWWLLFLPVNILYFLSIPDVRRDHCVKFFPFSFIMCMVWIGAISYELTWLITVIGYTINVPDTVMGLSFLAVGTSIPEVFSSLIVAKQV